MRRFALLATIVALSGACQPSTPAASGHGPSPSASAPPSASATASAHPTATATSAPSSGPATLTGPYGILLRPGNLLLIKPDATVAATVDLAPPSVVFCSSAQDGAMEPPPVSASNTQVYFRDGDTKIRSVNLPSGATDLTTVPGAPTTVSFFSVSPDDQRIAVVVEDVSAATTISLRLYVEDLVGHGHHADIYTTTQPKGKTGTTLWPLGWHQGALVLAVGGGGPFQPAGLTPSEGHLSPAPTAVRNPAIRAHNFH